MALLQIVRLTCGSLKPDAIRSSPPAVRTASSVAASAADNAGGRTRYTASGFTQPTSPSPSHATCAKASSLPGPRAMTSSGPTLRYRVVHRANTPSGLVPHNRHGRLRIVSKAARRLSQPVSEVSDCM